MKNGNMGVGQHALNLASCLRSQPPHSFLHFIPTLCRRHTSFPRFAAPSPLPFPAPRHCRARHAVAPLEQLGLPQRSCPSVLRLLRGDLLRLYAPQARHVRDGPRGRSRLRHGGVAPRAASGADELQRYLHARAGACSCAFPACGYRGGPPRPAQPGAPPHDRREGRGRHDGVARAFPGGCRCQERVLGAEGAERITRRQDKCKRKALAISS